MKNKKWMLWFVPVVAIAFYKAIRIIKDKKAVDELNKEFKYIDDNDLFFYD